MPALSTLHHELRARVPDKPTEFYDDALRWAINHICVKTSLWKAITEITTVAGKSVYDLDLPVNTVTHSNLYIVQKGATDRVLRRPANGFRVTNFAPSDYLQAFKSYSKNEVEIAPEPLDGGVDIEVHTAVKPTSSATEVSEDKFFEEYKDTVVSGGLHRCFKLDNNMEMATIELVDFKNGVDSIHVDVLLENADTPLRVKARW